MDDTAEFLGRGWSFPPRVDAVTGRFLLCEGEEDIRQAIYIILMTRLGERQMMPDFGSNLHEYIFELPDASSMALLRSEVLDTLIRWEPRVVDLDVDVDASRIAEGRVELEISYTVRATNNPGNLVFPYYLYEGVGID